MMRLFGALKTTALLAAAIMVFLLSAAPSPLRADSSNPYRYPANVARTCSGGISGPGMEVHVFGFKGPGDYCSTRVFYATSYAEAMECARAACDNCEVIEEITGKVKFGTALEGLELLKDYCQQ
jgi:hypothetical protein